MNTFEHWWRTEGYVLAIGKDTARIIWIAALVAAPTTPEVDESYKRAWVDGFESRQGEIDSLGAELLREKNIAFMRGPRPDKVVYDSTRPEVEPVAWMVPHIISGSNSTLSPDFGGIAMWGAEVFCDSRHTPRVDKNGKEHYPYPLYKTPPSPKAEWDADGNPLNLEAAARDLCYRLENSPDVNLDYLEEWVGNLRKFLPEGK